MDPTDIAAVETQAYRARWDDGLFDVFFGAALAWMGIAWLWIEPLAGLAGVFPAIFVVPFVSFRRRFIESRAGYVRFSAERRRWERRNLVLLFAFGTATLALGVGAFLAANGGDGVADVLDDLAPGMISFLLALAVLIVAVVSALPRLFVYATALVVGGVVAVVTDANPGAPLLPVGALVVAWGGFLLVRFIAAHPPIGESVAG